MQFLQHAYFCSSIGWGISLNLRNYIHVYCFVKNLHGHREVVYNRGKNRWRGQISGTGVLRTYSPTDWEPVHKSSAIQDKTKNLSWLARLWDEWIFSLFDATAILIPNKRQQDVLLCFDTRWCCLILQGLYSISRRTSNRKISKSLEGARFEFRLMN